MMFLVEAAKSEIDTLGTVLRHNSAISVEPFATEDAGKGITRQL
jgi:hypothetical protein